MNRKRLINAVKRISAILNNYNYKCASRQNQTYFSREAGKIGFVNMIAITLNFLVKSMQIELDNFFEHALEKTEKVSKQAYSEARFKLKTEAFRILFDDTAELASQMTGEANFKGYRVLAVDGTTVALEATYSLREYFGVLGGGKGYAAARASVMVDVLNKGLILDAQIDKLSCGEGKLAIRHFNGLKELQVEKPILVYDRGYASSDMFEELNDVAFLFRLKRGFNSQIDNLPLGDTVAEVTIKRKVFRLRALKFKLATGEIEALVTNVAQKTISSDELKELYNLRWGVETAYHTIKSALQIENFTGTSQLIVEQDFFATMFLKNMVAFAKLDSDEIIEQNENSENLYSQKTNENLLIGNLKDKLIIALLDTRPRAQAKKINAIIKEAARHTIPIRPDRHFRRIRKHSKRFNSSTKSAL